MDGYDVRMPEFGCRSGFHFETSEGGLGIEQSFGQQLERDPATEPSVSGQIDLAHPAAAEQAHDPEVFYLRALFQGVWSRLR